MAVHPSNATRSCLADVSEVSTKLDALVHVWERGRAKATGRNQDIEHSWHVLIATFPVPVHLTPLVYTLPDTCIKKKNSKGLSKKSMLWSVTSQYLSAHNHARALKRLANINPRLDGGMTWRNSGTNQACLLLCWTRNDNDAIATFCTRIRVREVDTQNWYEIRSPTFWMGRASISSGPRYREGSQISQDQP